MLPVNQSSYTQASNARTDSSQGRRGALFSLLFLGVVIVSLGVWQIVARVRKPFNPNFPDNAQVVAVNNKVVDTDGDGLTDYDEMYVYGTSPYLEDTDSDEILDIEEIKKGSDPNCPEGGSCFTNIDFEVKPNTVVNEDDLNTSNITGTSSLGEINISENVSEEELRRALSGEIDAASLRAMLLEGGADEEILSKISDEELLTSYQEVLNNNKQAE